MEVKRKLQCILLLTHEPNDGCGLLSTREDKRNK